MVRPTGSATPSNGSSTKREALQLWPLIQKRFAELLLNYRLQTGKARELVLRNQCELSLEFAAAVGTTAASGANAQVVRSVVFLEQNLNAAEVKLRPSAEKV